jgi:hypothetical protein
MPKSENFDAIAITANATENTPNCAGPKVLVINIIETNPKPALRIFPIKTINEPFAIFVLEI